MIPRHLQIAFLLLLAGVFTVSGYMLHVKNRASEMVADSRPVAAPVTTPAEPVTLFVAYDDEGVLLKRSVMAPLPTEPTARAKEILRTLFAEYLDAHSPHPIGAGSDVREVFLVNNGLAVVDLNQAFADGHRSGVWEESLTIDSMVATLAVDLPQVTQVKFLVNGQEHETLAGHADLMSVYHVEDVDRIIEALH